MIKTFYLYIITRIDLTTVKNTISEGQRYKRTVLKNTDFSDIDAYLKAELEYYTERLNIFADEINSKLPSFLHVKKESRNSSN